MLIKTYGLFWKAEDVFWGYQNRRGTLLGVETSNKKEKAVDFRLQIGVYVLYDDNFRIIYIGQVGANDKQRLFGRLRQHSNGRLADRWTRFSWFGLCGVNDKGILTREVVTAKNSKKEIVDHIEAVLIATTEPPQNRQSGRFGEGVSQYRQYRDELSIGPNLAEMVFDLYHRKTS